MVEAIPGIKREYDGKTYKFVNQRKGYVGYRHKLGDEIVVKPDGTIAPIDLATEWVEVSNG